jgi:hypothetical protein
MKKTFSFLTLAGLLGCGAPPGSDHEEVEAVSSALDQVFTSPYGPSTPVDVVIGSYGFPIRSALLVYRRRSDHACSVYQLGSYVLTSSVTVYLTDGADWARITPAGSPTTIDCSSGIYGSSLTLNEVGQNATSYITLLGLGGNDALLCSGPPGSGNSCDGGSGDDYLKAETPTVALYGGPGNDKLIATASGHGLALYGQGGDDCLQLGPGDAPWAYDCGAGWGDSATGNTGVGCEFRTLSCVGD